jgi:hypothetical protein
MLRNLSTLFGGPSQPEPLDERGGIHRARLLAQEDEQCLNANQYENDGVRNLLKNPRTRKTLTSIRIGNRTSGGPARKYTSNCQTST